MLSTMQSNWRVWIEIYLTLKATRKNIRDSPRFRGRKKATDHLFKNYYSSNFSSIGLQGGGIKFSGPFEKVLGNKSKKKKKKILIPKFSQIGQLEAEIWPFFLPYFDIFGLSYGALGPIHKKLLWTIYQLWQGIKTIARTRFFAAPPPIRSWLWILQ